MTRQINYFPGVYHCSTLQEAKAIILTPEAGKSTEQRWQEETAWLKDFLQFHVEWNLPILDYGCGVGRIAKELNRSVVGVDISSTMRAQAEKYVNNENFLAVSPASLQMLTHAGLRCGGAICFWVLQHCLYPKEDIANISAVLVPGATLWVLNQLVRGVPIKDDTGELHWLQDNIDIFDLLQWHFSLASEISSPIIPGAVLRKYIKKPHPT